MLFTLQHILDVWILLILLERHAPGNHESGGYCTALRLAAAQGSSNMVFMLIEHGADVNRLVAGIWGTPLQIVARYGHYDVVSVLLHHGAAPDARLEFTVLLYEKLLHQAILVLSKYYWRRVLGNIFLLITSIMQKKPPENGVMSMLCIFSIIGGAETFDDLIM